MQDDRKKQNLAEAMGRELSRARIADGDDPQDVERDVERSIKRISQAPIVLVACLDMTEMDRYPDPQRNQAEYLMAVQSVAMVGQNIMLLAYAEGLGTCWMCAPLFSPSSVHEAFDIPPEWIPQGLILLGHAETAVNLPNRKPLKEVVRWS